MSRWCPVTAPEITELQGRICKLRETHEARPDAEDRRFDRAESWAEVAVDAQRLGEYTLSQRLLEIAGTLHESFKGVTP